MSVLGTHVRVRFREIDKPLQVPTVAARQVLDLADCEKAKASVASFLARSTCRLAPSVTDLTTILLPRGMACRASTKPLRENCDQPPLPLRLPVPPPP